MNHSLHLKLVLGAVAIAVVLAALGVPVLANLPLLAIVLVCPLMMIFMMRSMNHGSGPNDQAGTADEATHSAHRH